MSETPQRTTTGERLSALVGAAACGLAWLWDLVADALGSADAPGTVVTLWIVGLLLFGGSVADIAWRHSRAGQRYKLYTSPGWAGGYEFRHVLGRRGVRRLGKFVRPSLAKRKTRDGYKPKTTDYGLRLGRALTGTLWVRFRKVYAGFEKCLLMIGPMGQGKTALLINQILDAPGGLLVATTKTELYRETHELRAQMGPVLLFNPQNIGDAPSTLRWDPLSGCEDWNTAVDRATALVTGTKAITAMQEASWGAKCIEILAAYMFAARLSGYDFRLVAHWVTNPHDKSAVNFLRGYENGRYSATADFLQSEIDSSAERMKGSLWSLASSAVKFITNPQIAAACTNVGAAGFDAERFARDKGTLYLVGDSNDDTIAPLLNALTSYVYTGVKAAASRTRTGRLDPPFGFFLDEASKITPVPAGAWAADGRGHGIYLVLILQSFDQLRGRWGEEGAAEIRDIYSKVIFGGIQNMASLKELCDLVGARAAQVKSRGKSKSATGTSRSETTNVRTESILTPAQLQQLPRGHVLVILGGARAVVVKFKKGHIRAAKARKRLANEQRKAAARPEGHTPPRSGSRPTAAAPNAHASRTDDTPASAA